MPNAKNTSAERTILDKCKHCRDGGISGFDCFSNVGIDDASGVFGVRFDEQREERKVAPSVIATRGKEADRTFGDFCGEVDWMASVPNVPFTDDERLSLFAGHSSG